MPESRARRGALAAALLLVPLLAPAGAVADGAVSVDEALARLVSYVRTHQGSDGAFRGGGAVDTGAFHTWQVVVALSAAGLDPRDVRAGPGDPSVVEWLRENRALHVTEDQAWQKQVLAITASYGNPASFGGHDYVTSLRGEVEGGRAGREDYVNEEMFAILAFRAAGVGADDPDVRALRDTIRDHQNADGSWAAGSGQSASVDMTAVGVAALVAAGASASDDAVRAAVEWLRAQQVNSGGFRQVAAGSKANVQSTAWALWGLRSAGEDPSTWVNDAGNDPVTYLAGTVREDGRVEDAWGAARGLWESIDAITGLAAAHYPVKGWLPVDASVDTETLVAAEPVRFEDAGPGTRHAWDFGDGTVLECDASGCGSSDAPEHAYAAPGTYEVRVDAWDDAYGHGFATFTVNVVSRPPVAAVDASRTAAHRGVSVTFDALASEAPDGEIEAFRWNFDDGRALGWGDHAVVDHAFDDLGTFNVTVRVRNDAGQEASAFVHVTVENRPPVVTPFADVTAEAFENVTFEADASDPDGADEALAYEWDLGDGNATTGVNVTHAYEAAGTFPVTLTVTDPDGGEVATSFDVTVTEPGNEVSEDESDEDDESDESDEPEDEPAALTAGNLTVDPARPVAGEAVTFTVDADGARGNVSFEWAFGDGSESTTPNPEARHAYEAAGRYAVRVTVTDEDARTAHAFTNVTVAGPPEDEADGSDPVDEEDAAPAGRGLADATLDAPADVLVREDAILEVVDAPAGARYRFDFGDGIVTEWGDAALVAHAYDAPGAYEVRVTVESAEGESRTLRTLVEVVNAPPEVRFTEPVNGTAVMPGVVTLRGKAWDADGEVASVTVWTGGRAATVTGTTSWTAALDLSHARPGDEVEVRARAKDADGLTGPEATLRLVMDAPGSDRDDAPDEQVTLTESTAPENVRESPMPAVALVVAVALLAAIVTRGGRSR